MLTLNLHFTNPIFGRIQNASQSSQMTAEEVSHNSVDNAELCPTLAPILTFFRQAIKIIRLTIWWLHMQGQFI